MSNVVSHLEDPLAQELQTEVEKKLLTSRVTGIEVTVTLQGQDPKAVEDEIRENLRTAGVDLSKLIISNFYVDGKSNIVGQITRKR